MSIINDALNKNRESFHSRVPQIKVEISRPRRRSIPLGRVLSLAFILFSIAGLSFYSFYQRPKEDFSINNVVRHETAAVPLEKPAEPVYSEKTVPEKTDPEKTDPEKTEVLPTPSPLPSIVSQSREMVRLNGIMYTNKGPLAIVNNYVLNEGDTFDNFKVLEIGKDYVRLSRGDEEFEVRLGH